MSSDECSEYVLEGAEDGDYSEYVLEGDEESDYNEYVCEGDEEEDYSEYVLGGDEEEDFDDSYLTHCQFITSDKHTLVEKALIPKYVFDAMDVEELVGYIIEGGVVPYETDDKMVLAEQAYQSQPKNLCNELAQFQLDMMDDIQRKVTDVAKVQNRERMRWMWNLKISKLEVRVPRPVVECIIKHVILSGDKDTINNARRINRDFKCVFDSELCVNAIKTLFKIKSYEATLDEYNIYYGDGVYTTHIEGIGLIPDPHYVSLLGNKIRKIDERIYLDYRQTIESSHDVETSLKHFKFLCKTQHNSLSITLDEQIKLM